MSGREPLTPKQLELYDYIKAFIILHGYPPTLKELGRHFDRTSATLSEAISILKQKGYIKTKKGHWRSIQIVEEN